jgi:transposase
MLALTEDTRVVVRLERTDMRKGIVGLALLAKQSGENLSKGAWYVFFGRTKNSVKILTWEGDGFALYYKRLSAGTFRISYNEDQTREVITGVDLQKLLSGICFSRVRLQKKSRENLVIL